MSRHKDIRINAYIYRNLTQKGISKSSKCCWFHMPFFPILPYKSNFYLMIMKEGILVVIRKKGRISIQIQIKNAVKRTLTNIDNSKGILIFA